MAIFKCKMCGGALEIQEGQTTCQCEYCGTTQTIPRLDSDRRANLYDRANHFRRNNDFDKAANIYEQILNEDSTDAEAYWSLVLCRYGIEYVEDPSSHKRLPTVNRAQFTSVFDDDNYRSAVANADMAQKRLYEQEAAQINEIQKGILAISQKEEPFDVFICYKETDANGRRTPDSVLANDLYHQLTNEGYKVFFARITLEDKLGSAYEPYIFAALNSAKVMVVLGTRPEYFNAVWVKNEWSRYLSLVKQSGGRKVLIPAYRDMDPYDLPEEFSHLQAQDMGKLGFMQDLIRGIKKITAAEKPAEKVTETVVVSSGNANVAPLLKRAFIFLEDKDWNSANEYCERVLDADPENAQAYLGKLMAELRCSTQADIPNCPEPFDNKNNYQKAIRYGDEKVKSLLTSAVAHIRQRNETARLDGIYNDAMTHMNSAGTEGAYQVAADIFASISGYKDADEKAAECREKGTECIYQRAIEKMEKAFSEMFYLEAAEVFDSISDFRDAKAKAAECKEKAEDARKDSIYCIGRDKMQLKENPSAWEQAIREFSRIPGWRDADEKVKACEKQIEDYKVLVEQRLQERRRIVEEANIAAEKAARRKGIVIAIIALVLLLGGIGWYYYNAVIVPDQKLSAANELYDAGKYEEAIKVYRELDGCAVQMQLCREGIKQRDYNKAKALYDEGNYAEAYSVFLTIKGYKDVNTLLETDPKLLEIAEQKAKQEQYKKVGSYVVYGHYEQDNDSDNGKEIVEWRVLAYDADKNQALLISRYGLDAKQYHSSTSYPTWEKSDIREWLNSTFLNEAFSELEQKAIVKTHISTPSMNGNSGGKDTDDFIWLLSQEESQRYFSSVSDRRIIPTEYAITQGVRQGSRNKIDGVGCCQWWLRSLGDNSYGASYVNADGMFSDLNVSTNTVTVRPAMWLDLDKLP